MDPHLQATAHINRFKPSLTTNKQALSTKDVNKCSQVQRGRGEIFLIMPYYSVP